MIFVTTTVIGRISGRALGAAVLCFFAVLIAGCSGGATRKELPVPIQYALQATATVNPSISGRASPIVVVVYELKNSTTFAAADFLSLLKDDPAVLGQDRISRQEYVLQPGEIRLVRRRADLETRFVGVAAGYRDIEGSVWRAIAPIPAPNRAGVLWSSSSSPERRLVIKLDKKAVTVVDETDTPERK